jgi:predicted ATPase
MLTHIDVNGYKCLDQCSLPLAPLTLLTGPNASGKSTLIQAILLTCSGAEQKNQPYLKEIIKPYAQFEDVYCRYSNADKIKIVLKTDSGSWQCTIDADSLKTSPDRIDDSPGYEENLFYLCAGRTGPEEISSLNRELHIGAYGQFALGFLDQRKDKPVHPALIHPKSYANTLKAQLAWWLSFILDQHIEAKTEKITATSVKTTFHSDGIGNISPLNTGAGNSFVLKLLILCLTATPGDLLLLENPEIHLHPGAQSRLGSLMAFLSAKGIQIIAETHCEHLINRIRYEVYKKQILPGDVLIHYKKNVQEPFEILKINHNGHFCNIAGEEKNFPGGFFDSTLMELLEIS